MRIGWPCGIGGAARAAVLVAAWVSASAHAQPPGDPPGPPAASGSAAIVPYWQASAAPQTVIQGGAIPPGWQPQAIPYQGIGPDGRPMTVYLAPTYVFTYQAGPPVLAVPAVNRPQARGAAVQPVPTGWNYATSGAPPVAPALPPATVARYQPVPYQFPSDARALTGTPVVPPAEGLPVPPAPVAAPAPPPSQWIASTAPPLGAPPVAAAPPMPAPPSAPSSGDWVTVVPPAVAGAVLAQGPSSAPMAPAVAAAPPVAAPPPAGVPAQPVSAAPRATPTHLWRVVGVHDGDTITCLDENNQQQKVRLASIDAPEVGQEYGRASREALAAMVFGKTVAVADQGRDQYGRWIGSVSVDGLDVNRQMIATGNAWHYTEFSNDPTLAALQEQARAQKTGLWSQPDPIPPWQFRHQGSAT
jgi:endonuclease YncB( thermonuclease family)